MSSAKVGKKCFSFKRLLALLLHNNAIVWGNLLGISIII